LRIPRTISGVSAAPLISVSNLEKTCLTRGRALAHALGGISLDVATGELITIVGQSGCGKTTFEGTVPAADYYTSALLAEINRFDQAAVIRLAREYRAQ